MKNTATTPRGSAALRQFAETRERDDKGQFAPVAKPITEARVSEIVCEAIGTFAELSGKNRLTENEVRLIASQQIALKVEEIERTNAHRQWLDEVTIRQIVAEAIRAGQFDGALRHAFKLNRTGHVVPRRSWGRTLGGFLIFAWVLTFAACLITDFIHMGA